jgi:hypothetical protein
VPWYITLALTTFEKKEKAAGRLFYKGLLIIEDF